MTVPWVTLYVHAIDSELSVNICCWRSYSEVFSE